MKTSFSKLVLILALAFLAAHTPNQASAQLKPGGSGDSRGPIAISSDRMESDDPQGVVHFFGDVVARQGDMTITCDRMDVLYDRQEQTPASEGAERDGQTANSALGGRASRQIDRIECHGNVKVWEGERVATGQKALYLAQSLPRRIVLTGEARVWQGGDSLTGHQVTYYLDTERSLVEGGQGGRVRTMYNNQEGGQK